MDMRNSTNRFSVSHKIVFLFVAVLATAPMTGCKKSSTSESSTPQSSEAAATPSDSATVPESVEFSHPTFESSAEELLGARLSEDEAADGWIRLFDGHTLFGWEITGKANWRVEDGTIVVDDGEKCLLCTSMSWDNFELTFEFNADKETNSGVFVRTPLQPSDVATECYEINIAPDDNPFPTASIVKREKVSDDAPDQTFNKWRRMTIRVENQDVKISLGDKVVCEYSDPQRIDADHIGLQHNSGRVAFRDIRLKPLGLKSMLDKDLSQWTKYPKMPGEFTTTDDGSLQVKGGRTQLETKESYDDFVLLAQYKMADEKMNSGIFFRCIPGDEMMGYECQVSNECKDGNRLAAADCGTGGIFRRQDARVVAGEPDKWATVLLTACGPKIAAWVNGVQVSNWQDDRKPHENPRKGLRLDAGTIMIQGHDPGTDALFKQLSIAELKK